MTMLFHLQHIAGLAGRSMWINDKFWNIISFSLFISISPYLMSFRFGRYAFANIVSSLHECVSNHTTKKKFMEMIFHFLLKNDLFHRRGQEMVPIHFCNYIHWDTFHTKFYRFCLKCIIEPFFTRFFCTIAW